MAQAGCAVDSPIVALNLKGEKEDRRAGRRWRGGNSEVKGCGSS